MKKLALLAVAALFMSGCASSIVHKPEVYEVKKLAIISLYSNHGVYNVKGGGGLTAGLSALGSITGNRKLAKVADFGGDRLVNYALKTYEAEFSKIPNWQVVPFKKVYKTKAYKSFTQRMEKHGRMISSLASLNDKMWKAPKGMKPFLGQHDDSDESPTMKDLQKLAKELNVDAVAVVKLDIGYAPDFAVGSSVAGNFGGNGTAVASADSSIKIVTKNSKHAVLTPELKQGGGHKHRSEESTILLGGNIKFDKKVEKMYQDVIFKTAQYWRENIVKDL